MDHAGVADGRCIDQEVAQMVHIFKTSELIVVDVAFKKVAVDRRRSLATCLMLSSVGFRQWMKSIEVTPASLFFNNPDSAFFQFSGGIELGLLVALAKEPAAKALVGDVAHHYLPAFGERYKRDNADDKHDNDPDGERGCLAEAAGGGFFRSYGLWSCGRYARDF